jgi:aminocarboxymuconate-semialdehyde decarboxylase
LPLLIHPNRGSLDLEGAPGGTAMSFGLGFPLETTAALGRMIYAGVLDRFTGLRVVAAHCGGALPALIGRMQAFWETRSEADASVPGPPAAVAARLAFDGVGYGLAAIRAAVDLAGAERVFFGTDHPFPVSASPANEVALEGELHSHELALVYGAGAAAFFELPAP